MTYLFSRRMALACSLGCLNLPLPALATAASCYGPLIPAPPARRRTVLLVDLTTPTPRDIVAPYRRTARAAAVEPGQRLVMLSFAGIAAGQTIAPRLDAVVEAEIKDRRLIEDLPIRPFQRSQACVRKALAAWPSRVDAELGAMLNTPQRQALQRSEIIHALRSTITAFAQPGVPTRILVYSDGLQHGSGMSFHGPGGRPRRIDAGAELARLPPAMRAALPQPAGDVQVLWWGLLAEAHDERPAASAYHDARTLEQLQTFWTSLLRGWGVGAVSTDSVLLDPEIGWGGGGLADCAPGRR